MSSDQEQASNYVVVVHGRGVLHVALAKGTLEEVTERAEGCLLSGFEVHVYSLKLDDVTRSLTYLPAGLSLLKQEWHMWDAGEEVKDLTDSIINHMDEHTAGMARRYLTQAIGQLQEELVKLEPQTPDPQFTEPEAEGSTTGS